MACILAQAPRAKEERSIQALVDDGYAVLCYGEIFCAMP